MKCLNEWGASRGFWVRDKTGRIYVFLETIQQCVANQLDLVVSIVSFLLNWILLQCCVSFKYTAKWFSYIHTHTRMYESVCRSVVSNSLRPVDCGPPGSSVHGILQAGILKWFAIPFSKGPSWPMDRTLASYVFCIGRWVLYFLSHQRSPHLYVWTHPYTWRHCLFNFLMWYL